ncbi:hypothetical protein BDZ89DRAFT_1033763 [Hymenopellis radicata]|nr:hypothetical protein BDZ89DRAFT_1033763 [Hymenopellis radicata]
MSEECIQLSSAASSAVVAKILVKGRDGYKDEDDAVDNEDEVNATTMRTQGLNNDSKDDADEVAPDKDEVKDDIDAGMFDDSCEFGYGGCGVTIVAPTLVTQGQLLENDGLKRCPLYISWPWIKNEWGFFQGLGTENFLEYFSDLCRGLC